MRGNSALGNILGVVARDLKRLAHAPAAWLVAAFLIVLPSLYTWFNVYGFWNPYEHTEDLNVCVVNEDAGASDEALGQLQVGDTIVQQLQENGQMGWSFTQREEAMSQLRAGQAYAVFVIPRGFSESIAALASGNLQPASIEYYVNEKMSPVSPKIMDTGANTLDAAINGAFASTVSEVVATALGDTVAELEADVSQATATAFQRVDEAEDSLGAIRGNLSQLKESAEGAARDSAQARESLAEGKDSLASLSGDLAQASRLMGDTSTSLSRLSLSLGTALDSGSSALSLGSAQTNIAIGKVAAQITAGKGDADAAIALAKNATESQDEMIKLVRDLEASIPDDDVKGKLEAAVALLEADNTSVKALVGDIQTLSDSLGASALGIAGAANSVNDATQQALEAGGAYRSTLGDSTLPAIGNGIAAIGGASSSLSAAVASQSSLVDEACSILSQLETALGQTAKALEETDGILASAQDELLAIRADLSALGSADTLADFLGEDGIDSSRVADFMFSPTKVQTEELYPLDAYGSAMAPLFINLTLWIGVFMLMVIMRIEVDAEELRPGTTVAQRFLGRQLLLSAMAALQAVVCCAGCMAMGVQTANPVLFVLTAVLASLSYLAIQYSLSATFQHLGKAICVILVFVQIPGATGLYPIEMTTSFFRTVYPMFPFTYGINAIRETVFGFYGNLWAVNILVLLAFMLAFTLIGSVVRPFAGNLNRLFERQIEQTDLLNIEPVQLPARRYRVEQLIYVLSDREEFRHDIEQRAQRFLRRYPRLRWGAAIAGIVMPIVATPIFIATGIDKAIILMAWLLWLIAVAVSLVIVEYLRDSMLHQLSLSDLSGAEIRALYFNAQGKDIPISPNEPPRRRGRHERPAEGAAPADEGGAR